MASVEWDHLLGWRDRLDRDWFDGHERTVALAIATFTAILATLVSTQLFPYHSVNHDEGVYLQQAAMLLEGQLVIRPPVAEAFRPWFFVRQPDGALYPKYAPVPAATFALGKLLGSARFALAGVAFGNTILTYTLVASMFDRRRGLLAAVLLSFSPMFLIQSGLFLPYATTTFWNLGFAVGYVRADQTGSLRWAAVAGLCVGVAFFARPYTAVLFAAPFVLHAVWSLRGRVGTAATLLGLDRATVARQSVTAVGGLAGVAAALGYNAVVTGSPLVFPYQAFAPLDGIGFGYREILGYDRTYTLSLALRANAEVVWMLFTRWVTAGPVGTLLAAVGLGALAARVRNRVTLGRSARHDTVLDRQTQYRLLLAGTFLTVIAGNVAFWGNLNVLGELADPSDGLIASLGPYYHFDLLVPTAAFAADGVCRLRKRLTATAGNLTPADREAIPSVVVALLLAVTLVGTSAVVVAEPVERNAEVTADYEAAYEPFRSDSAGGLDTLVTGPDLSPPTDAVVFLPTPYGDWLAHPFQSLRNDPGFDGETIYALRERQFAVQSAFPERDLYRFTYRGQWTPGSGPPVEPRLQNVQHRSGQRVTLSLSLGIPDSVASVSVRLAGVDGETYYAANSTDAETLPLTLSVVSGSDGSGDGGDSENATARLDGPLTAVGDESISLDGHEDLQLVVFLDHGTGGFSYRFTLPTLTESGQVRVLSPSVEVCRRPARCGGSAAYLPGELPPGASLDFELTAGGNTTVGENATVGKNTTAVGNATVGSE
jgi:hypothetical protein